MLPGQEDFTKPQHSGMTCIYSYTDIEFPEDMQVSRDVNNYSEIEATSAQEPYNTTEFNTNAHQLCTSNAYIPESYSPLEFSGTKAVYNTVDYSKKKKKQKKSQLKCSLPPDFSSYSAIESKPEKEQYESTSHTKESKKKISLSQRNPQPPESTCSHLGHTSSASASHQK